MRKVVLFIGPTSSRILDNAQKSLIKSGRSWQIRNLVPISKNKDNPHKFTHTDQIDFANSENIKQYFAQHTIISITARGEKNIPLLQKIIPFAPKHILLPSVESLSKATEKHKMRKAFHKYDKTITPKFFVFEKYSPEITTKIQKKLDFPVIVKPSGLASSAFVHWAHYPEELDTILKKSFKKLESFHKENKGRGEAVILVEEFIDGTVFSTDAHINDEQEVIFNPFIRYKMAPQKGYDDFFVYDSTVPVTLKPETIQAAQDVAIKGIKALDLKNSSAHIEIIRDHEGQWKIIEMGPRLGGNRDWLYGQTYGTLITHNDILVHAGKKISIPKKNKGYSSMMRFYPSKEGYIKRIEGIKKIQKLESFVSISVQLRKGDKALFARHGGKYIFLVRLFHTNKAQLTADKRKLEKMVHIETVSLRKNL